ncbi:MAG: hypothetical protein COV32_00515 [Candidatus Yonathbacteria bacterium CG10_big_fil_rev_8_21_14_0_10_43_136]|uniref:Uncharacterized protein n=2 Tax=Parcubacteria group TaxID=1794811 RepID=A0A2M7Q4D9_9BACT|nr:MAG: hypothetical protein AUK15_00280 [Candidatus Nomurabacteria bacterium CG2_30_43_9]PIQ35703.1 MAG: hypothetical protein COW60_02425 [Candidatus Yonathbacteria bacterium CG17_big_fil_post_rev_8_21_14_2_50_43_9]PIR40921.1 MAG: hypothetical protein COV32_00515 [Candidatus Yonathbacteria bacterium CG10_big_fil_rev_8_21_14_0_10_43_136]PIX57372.1 MAG: hypothetical protein COZ48_00775 [Candidatus Yonathbacteria bacterium CG_4_10_14_3_um_filter_43_12]PIY58287.1 MAG: hypothetical protein COY98_02
MTRLTNIFLRLREQSQVWFSRFIILVLLGLIFFVAGGGVSHNKKWQIIQINVEGANAVSSDEVRAIALERILGNYFLIYSRNNSYLFPESEIAQTLLHTFPRISSVSAFRDDEHTITINISERKPYALWCEMQISKDCWFIDEGGFVFDKAPDFSKGAYIEVYGKLVEKNAGEPLRASLPYDRFIIANSFTNLLRDNIGKPFRIALKSEDEFEVTMYTSARHQFLADVTIRFNDASDPAVLISNLEKAILTQFPNNTSPKKRLQYIDMRFGNKVIFGFEQ